MLNCEQASKLFYEYMDKALSVKDVTRLEEHLSACADCSGHLSFDQALREFVKKKSIQKQLPDSFKKSILSKLKQ